MPILEHMKTLKCYRKNKYMNSLVSEINNFLSQIKIKIS